MPPQSPAPALDFQYNHDLDVSEDFLAFYPAIRGVLQDERLLTIFRELDERAQAHKRAFHRLGIGALILGLTPLVVAAVRMTMGEPLFSGIAGINVGAELSGILSMCLVIWARLRRHRLSWCHAVFCRERLRQWHFQLCLDGRLVERLAAGDPAARKELEQRWVTLQQNMSDGQGLMIEFVAADSHDGDLMHPVTEYTNPAIGAAVFEALQTLRFDHQLRFGRRKIDPDGEGKGLALKEHDTLSETVGSLSLAGAITMSVLAFLASGAHMVERAAWLPWDHLAITRSLSGIALLLGVLSAGSRAYRAGFTLPDESESYEEYCDHLREAKAVFRSASSADLKLRELQRLEQEAAAELRRFLRMKTRATFIL